MSAPRIAVIDYGMGNLRSVCKALEVSGADACLVSEASGLDGMAAIVFPGQGALGSCVQALKRTGLDRAIIDWIGADKPYLGICLGLQALFEKSEESGEPGLGIFSGDVRRFPPEPGLKVPHMGWNETRFVNSDSLLRQGLESSGEQFYFVHSYHVVPEDPALALCVTDYGSSFVSGIQRGNCYAVQFHPEKSLEKGLRILRNFVGIAAC